MQFVLPPLASLTGQRAHPPGREPTALAWPAGETSIPNFSDWQAGDLVLIKSSGTVVSSTIEGVQASIRSSSPPFGEPEWTHVAIYVGHGLVVESVPLHGMRYAPVHHYVLNRAVRVRRLNRGGVPIAAHEGEWAVKWAASFFTSGYAYAAIARHLLMHMKTTSPGAEAFFCSSLVAITYTKALGVLLESDPNHRPLLPATLVNHPRFSDVLLEWRV